MHYELHYVHSPYTFNGMQPVFVPVRPMLHSRDPSPLRNWNVVGNGTPQGPYPTECKGKGTMPMPAPTNLFPTVDSVLTVASTFVVEEVGPDDMDAFESDSESTHRVSNARFGSSRPPSVSNKAVASPCSGSGAVATPQEKMTGEKVEMHRKLKATAKDKKLKNVPCDVVAVNTVDGSVGQAFKDPHETEKDADTDDTDDESGAVPAKVTVLVGTPCPHTSRWKRLRAKKGSANYLCSFCGAKWKKCKKIVQPVNNDE